MKGADCNPRLSRSAQTEQLARQRLAELIIDTYLIKQNHELVEESVFSEECEENLKYFPEYKDAKEDVILHRGISSCINFADFAVMWLNYKKNILILRQERKLVPKQLKHTHIH